MIQVVWEDNSILVVYKPPGIATQTSRIGQGDMVSEIKNYLAGKEGYVKGTEPYVGLIHRLDQPVSGLLVFAKDKQSAARLSEQLNSSMKKHYFALILGQPLLKKGHLENFLYKDKKENKAYLVKETFPEAKKAILNYEIRNSLMLLEENKAVSLVDVELLTGRFHQIRAQMAHAGMPLLGDYKYGSSESVELSHEIGLKNVALCAYCLSFIHPKTNKVMTFKEPPREEIFHAFLESEFL